MSQGSDPFAELYGEFADRLRGDRWQPDIDVFETDENLVIRVEVAGVAREDVRVGVDGQALRISGTRRPAEPSDARRLHQMEIASGPFERRVQVPIAFDRDRVSAHLAEGFLTVTLPKREPVQVKIDT
ncbi:MAG: Hsp20/alpha crystallin family protein [Myxococcales bacterium]|nr:Hsp20/alpha crystallin family protein [Myxococcales bacterium]